MKVLCIAIIAPTMWLFSTFQSLISLLVFIKPHVLATSIGKVQTALEGWNYLACFRARMTRTNSRGEQKGTFLRSDIFRLPLTKPSEHMWNIIKITTHCIWKPNSGWRKSRGLFILTYKTEGPVSPALLKRWQRLCPKYINAHRTPSRNMLFSMRTYFLDPVYPPQGSVLKNY